MLGGTFSLCDQSYEASRLSLARNHNQQVAVAPSLQLSPPKMPAGHHLGHCFPALWGGGGVVRRHVSPQPALPWLLLGAEPDLAHPAPSPPPRANEAEEGGQVGCPGLCRLLTSATSGQAGAGRAPLSRPTAAAGARGTRARPLWPPGSRDSGPRPRGADPGPAAGPARESHGEQPREPPEDGAPRAHEVRAGSLEPREPRLRPRTLLAADGQEREAIAQAPLGLGPET